MEADVADIQAQIQTTNTNIKVVAYLCVTNIFFVPKLPFTLTLSVCLFVWQYIIKWFIEIWVCVKSFMIP